MAKTNKQLNKERKKLTKDIILVLVVVAGLVSFFYNPQGVDMEFLRTLMGAIIGYYVGLKDLPIIKK